MRHLLILLFLSLSTLALSQRAFFYGFVQDSTTKEELVGTHIRNISSDKLAISDAYGKFRLTAQVGDSIVLSNVGYQMLLWIAKENWFTSERVTFSLPVDTIYLEEIVVGKLPEYSKYKQMIIDTQPEDTSFWYFGVPQPEMKGSVLEKKQYTNPLFIASHPITFWHHAFSKKEKQKRKMVEIQRQSGIRDKADQKFTREWVRDVTKLQGDRLTDFIAYCKFTPKYLAETPLYVIQERMLVLLNDFMLEEVDG
ncbi:MAG: hypothetical protein AAGA66_00815 [Bacteroidota bacterium]